MHIFLTGNKQVGKSTLIQRVLTELPEMRIGGFRTVSYGGSADGELAVYLIPASGPHPVFEPKNRVGVRRPSFQAFPEIFDTCGVQTLAGAEQSTLILMDEVGKMERNASRFCGRILELLEQDTPILGVLRKEGATPLQEWIRSHPKVHMIEVTEENRESLKEELRLLLRPEQ